MNDQNTATPQVDIQQPHQISTDPTLSRTSTTSSNSSSSLQAQERPTSSTQSLQTKPNRLSLTAGRLLPSRARSRSKSPAPIDTLSAIRSRRSDSESTYILKRDKMSHINIPRRSASPTEMSPTSATSDKEAHATKRRSDSYHSRRSSDDYRRLNGTVNHKGRHANDWLFGGFSLRDTVRGGVYRLRQRDDKR
ncbi:hypothetical protein ETB97_007350 [Aspergillus alliaceus]|uniref:Uncharacterized protein n=1 Tax=Petromyces alliaceus TaxID=209559 RepID=A0A8H6A808_PETAA|nr:hypothetical protein ETB97_007350 [Aspergillus burnettii]